MSYSLLRFHQTALQNCFFEFKYVVERINVPYSFKNIPLPDKHQYKLVSVNKIESFIANMRWKVVFFFLTNNSRNQSQDIKENDGFKTNKHPPHIKKKCSISLSTLLRK